MYFIARLSCISFNAGFEFYLNWIWDTNFHKFQCEISFKRRYKSILKQSIISTTIQNGFLLHNSTGRTSLQKLQQS